MKKWMLCFILMWITGICLGATGSGSATADIDTRDYILIVDSERGSPAPSTGSHAYAWHKTLTCSVQTQVSEGGKDYDCIGWTGTGSISSSGSGSNTGPIMLVDVSSSIIWNWVDTATEYWLDITVVGSGNLNVADGWQPTGTHLALAATPNAGWLFMGWSGDLTGDYAQTNTSLLMNDNKSITATFSNDADGDGLLNTQENSLGTDPRDSDSDDDGLFDSFEVYIHNTDPLDADTDDDNLTDGNEVSLFGTDPLVSDSDGDGLGDGAEVLTYYTNPLIADSDGDGLSDGDEINIYSTDPLVIDTDGDSLSDYEEMVTYNTNPNLTDSDADGLDDYAELNTHLTDPNDADSDDDALTDGMEVNTHLTDPNDADSDDDLLSDGLEINIYNTNPNLGDTSGDGIMDGYAVIKGIDPAVDQTGIYAVLIMNKVGFGDVTPISDLYSYGTNLTLEALGSQGMLFSSWSGSITGDYTAAITNIILNGHMDITARFSDDADGDGILNTNETALGTDPRNSDSDSDGLSDSQELYTYSTDPLVLDMDGDGLSDGEEILTYNTNPAVIDTDLDGFGDGYEVSTGYDPASANSSPELYTTIKTSIQLEFNAASGLTYRIEGAEALSSPWETIEDGITGTGGVVTRHYDIDVQSNKFFRAKRD